MSQDSVQIEVNAQSGAQGSEPLRDQTDAHERPTRKLRPVTLLAVGLLGLVACVIASTGPVRAAVQIGGDELFEVTKAFLVAKGHALYTEVYNDVPPLHTYFLAGLFRLFGPTIGVGRALAVAFGVLLLGGCFALVRRRCGLFAAIVASIALLLAPEVAVLSVSVMLEVPAIAVALWALWPVYRFRDTLRWPLLVLSGTVLALAFQIKFTAVVVAPALAVEVLLTASERDRKGAFARGARNLAIWGSSFALAFVVVGSLLGETYDLLWASQFSGQTKAVLEETGSHGFTIAVLFQHPEALWAAGVGILIVVLRRDWRRLAFPLAMLLTALGLHLTHRPWWSFYYLHFAVPFAWLSGYGVAELLRAGRATADGGVTIFGRLGNRLAASLLMALLLFNGGWRLNSVIERIQELPRVQDSVLIAKMKENGARTKWVYTRGDIHVFHAGLKVIPEVAVVPAKRIWSGRITDDQILKIVQRYQPEQMVLDMSRPDMDAELKKVAAEQYAPVCEEQGRQLYVLKELLAGK